MAKLAFSRSDVIAINERMSNKPLASGKASDGRWPHAVARAPASPVAAKVMREIGVSSKKISEAYRSAKISVSKIE